MSDKMISQFTSNVMIKRSKHHLYVTLTSNVSDFRGMPTLSLLRCESKIVIITTSNQLIIPNIRNDVLW